MTDVAHAMATAADGLLSALPPGGRRRGCYPFTDAARSQWSYFPGSRPGIELSELGGAARKAAHRLLATALSRAAFAQAVTIMAFEEVLDLDEHGELGRHSDGYNVAVFGEPADGTWAWRFEGHHVSVNVTLVDGQPVVAPLFLGSNPAQVRHDADVVVAPLLREEQLARALVTGLSPQLRAQAVIAGTAPQDIITANAATAGAALRPPGVAASLLPEQERAQLHHLLASYLGRLAPDLADAEKANIADGEVTFAWAGGLRDGDGHYYRIQAPGLLVEYDNTQRNANHAHTVLRRPGLDFGAGLLAGHLAAEHP
jgi:hypothetical protein